MKSRIQSSAFFMLTAGLVTVSTIAVAARPVPPPLSTGCDALVSVSCGNTFPQYTMTDVASDFYPAYTKLTDSGNIQFNAYENGNLLTYEWTPTGGLQLTGAWKNAEAAQARAVNVIGYNDVGGWVGTGSNSEPNTRMMVGNSAGEVTTIPHPKGQGYMYAHSINEQSMVVGYVNLPGGISNPDGFVAEDGSTYIRNGAVPFIWTPGGGSKTIPSVPEVYNIQDQGYFATTYFSQAFGVNVHGQVVGSDMKQGYGSGYAFIWDESEGSRSMGLLPGTAASAAFDINNDGIAVGYSGCVMNSSDGCYSTAPQKGFVWSKSGGMIQLDTLLSDVDKSRGDISINTAKQINERGQILAYASINNSPSRLVLLTPVPEPTTQGLMLLGLGCLSALTWKRRKHDTCCRA